MSIFNKDHYPTPADVILMMVGGLDLAGKHVLEPSAGAGNIVEANAGYIMINKPDDQGYRKLLWHAMLTPVPTDTFRLTSYTWIIPK